MRYQLILGLVGLFSIVYFGKGHILNHYDIADLSYQTPSPIIVGNDKFAISEGKLIVTDDGSDPEKKYSSQSNPLYNSIFWKPTNVKTSPKWKGAEYAEKLADIYLARTLEDGKLSKELKGITKLNGRKIDLPIVSIIVNNDDLFSPKNGIYVQGDSWHETPNCQLNEAWFDKTGNYSKRGEFWEIPAYAQFIEGAKDKRLVWEGEVGVRINGNATRSFPQKSLRLLSKRKLLPGLTNNLTESLILRNGGNESNGSFIQDMVLQNMLDSTNLIYQNGKPCVVLINGYYWGIHNIRDRWKNQEIARLTGNLENEVSVWERGKVQSGNEKYGKKLKKLFKKLKAEKFNFETIEKKINLANFADYLLFQAWVANADWPKNNYALYKVQGKKWKFMIQDLDLAMGANKVFDPYINVFHYLYNSSGELGLLYRNLISEKKFKKLLLERYDKLKFKGVFSSKKLKDHIELLKLELVKEISFHKRRWGNVSSIENWESRLNRITEIADLREELLNKQMTKRDFIPTDI